LQQVLNPGTYTIQAAYNGDDNNNNFAASATTTLAGGQVINKANSSVSLVPSFSPPAAFPVTGQAILLTATVSNTSPGTGVPTGQVQFFDGLNQIGTNQTLTNVGGQQQASVTFTPTTAVSHSLTAKYVNLNGTFNNNQTSITQQVNPATAQVVVTTNRFSAVVGDPITFIATVSAASPGSGSPNNSTTVTFSVSLNGGTAQTSTPNLNNGQATFGVPSLSLGTYTVNVTYNGGDPNFTTGNPGTLTLNVLTRNQGFVVQLYHDLLNRTPSMSEILGWSTQLDAGVSRTAIANGFVNSYEFRANEVQALYTKYLHRTPVIQPGWEGDGWARYLLAGNTVEQLASILVGSVEYFNRSSPTFQGNTNAAFVDNLYRDALGRTAVPDGENSWVPLLNVGVQRSTVGFAIINSGEAINDVVDGFYSRYLHRQPPPVIQAGWEGQGWSDAIQRGPLHAGLTDEQVIAAFIGSDEYFNEL
jgi:hypothetical protein